MKEIIDELICCLDNAENNIFFIDNIITIGQPENKVIIKNRNILFSIFNDIHLNDYIVDHFYGNIDLSGLDNIDKFQICYLPQEIHGFLDLSDNDAFSVVNWPLLVDGNVNLGFNNFNNGNFSSFINTIKGSDVVLNHNKITDFRFLEKVNLPNLSNLNLIINNIDFLPDFKIRKNKYCFKKISVKYDFGIKINIDNLKHIKDTKHNRKILLDSNNPICFIEMRALDLNDMKKWILNIEALTCQYIQLNGNSIDYPHLKYKKKWVPKETIKALFNFYFLKKINIKILKNIVDVNNKQVLSFIEFFELLNNKNIICYNNKKEEVL